LLTAASHCKPRRAFSVIKCPVQFDNLAPQAGPVMSDILHVKTFPVDGLASVVLPFAVLDADLRVYFSTNADERLLSAGLDYVIEATAAGGRQVRLLKPLKGFLTFAGVPDPCVKLQKFGVDMLPALNGWAERVAVRLAFLEHLLGLADLRPIGAPDPVTEAAAQEALYSHALRLPVTVGEIPVPVDGCSVLGWMHGKPAWISPESVAARVYAARQEPANEITLCDVVTRGLFFGRQPKVSDFTREVVIDPGEPLAVADGANWCDLFVNPALIEDPFELCVGIPALIVAAAPAASASDPCTYRVQAPISLMEGSWK